MSGYRSGLRAARRCACLAPQRRAQQCAVYSGVTALSVAYVIGALTNGPRKAAAERYLAFLATPASQAAYAKYGFVNAAPQALVPRPIP